MGEWRLSARRRPLRIAPSVPLTLVLAVGLGLVAWGALREEQVALYGRDWERRLFWELGPERPVHLDALKLTDALLVSWIVELDPWASGGEVEVVVGLEALDGAGEVLRRRVLRHRLPSAGESPAYRSLLRHPVTASRDVLVETRGLPAGTRRLRLSLVEAPEGRLLGRVYTLDRLPPGGRSSSTNVALAAELAERLGLGERALPPALRARATGSRWSQLDPTEERLARRALLRRIEPVVPEAPERGWHRVGPGRPAAFDLPGGGTCRLTYRCPPALARAPVGTVWVAGATPQPVRWVRTSRGEYEGRVAVGSVATVEVEAELRGEVRVRNLRAAEAVYLPRAEDTRSGYVIGPVEEVERVLALREEEGRAVERARAHGTVRFSWSEAEVGLGVSLRLEVRDLQPAAWGWASRPLELEVSFHDGGGAAVTSARCVVEPPAPARERLSEAFAALRPSGAAEVVVHVPEEVRAVVVSCSAPALLSAREGLTSETPERWLEPAPGGGGARVHEPPQALDALQVVPDDAEAHAVAGTRWTLDLQRGAVRAPKDELGLVGVPLPEPGRGRGALLPARPLGASEGAGDPPWRGGAVRPVRPWRLGWGPSAVWQEGPGGGRWRWWVGGEVEGEGEVWWPAPGDPEARSVERLLEARWEEPLRWPVARRGAGWVVVVAVADDPRRLGVRSWLTARGGGALSWVRLAPGRATQPVRRVRWEGGRPSARGAGGRGAVAQWVLPVGEDLSDEALEVVVQPEPGRRVWAAVRWVEEGEVGPGEEWTVDVEPFAAVEVEGSVEAEWVRSGGVRERVGSWEVPVGVRGLVLRSSEGSRVRVWGVRGGKRYRLGRADAVRWWASLPAEVRGGEWGWVRLEAWWEGTGGPPRSGLRVNGRRWVPEWRWRQASARGSVWRAVQWVRGGSLRVEGSEGVGLTASGLGAVSEEVAVLQGTPWAVRAERAGASGWRVPLVVEGEGLGRRRVEPPVWARSAEEVVEPRRIPESAALEVVGSDRLVEVEREVEPGGSPVWVWRPLRAGEPLAVELRPGPAGERWADVAVRCRGAGSAPVEAQVWVDGVQRVWERVTGGAGRLWVRDVEVGRHVFELRAPAGAGSWWVRVRDVPRLGDLRSASAWWVEGAEDEVVVALPRLAVGDLVVLEVLGEGAGKRWERWEASFVAREEVLSRATQRTRGVVGGRSWVRSDGEVLGSRAYWVRRVDPWWVEAGEVRVRGPWREGDVVRGVWVRRHTVR